MHEKKIVIIDYQLGNLFSVNQALINIGLNTIISSDPGDISTADAIILPGVGAFGDAMTSLKELGLVEPIKASINAGKPFLGICLGLQLLFDSSEEFGANEGLGIIKGTVKKFSNLDREYKIPQISWNQIFYTNENDHNQTPMVGIKNGEFFYFVHSYYVQPLESDVILTDTIYGNITYVSSIFKDNIFACQFHPEKSAQEGLRIYSNWASLNKLI